MYFSIWDCRLLVLQWIYGLCSLDTGSEYYCTSRAQLGYGNPFLSLFLTPGYQNYHSCLWQQSLSWSILSEPQKVFLVPRGIKNVSHFSGYLFSIQNKAEDTSLTRQLHRKTNWQEHNCYFYAPIQAQVCITKCATHSRTASHLVKFQDIWCRLF